MGCNCKQTKQVQTQVIIGTPEPIPPPVEIDHFNNIDEIKPIQDEPNNETTI